MTMGEDSPGLKQEDGLSLTYLVVNKSIVNLSKACRPFLKKQEAFQELHTFFRTFPFFLSKLGDRL